MVEPYMYQKPIIRDVVSALRRDGRALIVMAPGTGKTYTSALITKQISVRSDRILYLCHNNEILKQAEKSFRDVLGTKRSMGFFIGSEKADASTLTLFSTFQTMRNWKESFGREGFDIVIVDEGHHGQADTFRESIEYFRPRHMIALTATPDRVDERDIRELFGRETVILTLEEAIAKKYLAPVVYKVMTVGTASREALKRLKSRVSEGERISLRELNDEVFVEHLDEAIAEEIMRYRKQGIVFCTGIRQAENMAEQLSNARPYHSGLSWKECDAHLKKFRNGEIRFLLTVDKFNEGIDIPDAELVVFLRSTESKTIFLQQLGRGLRKAPNKRRVIVLDFVANAERMRQLSEFARDIKTHIGGGQFFSEEEFELDTSGIEFDLEEETKDILDILRRIELGFYRTLEEASVAVKKMGITTETQYKRRYKEDPRLPNQPFIVYAAEWVSWPHFLRGEQPRNFYPTLVEASVAAKEMGILSRDEYIRRYNANIRLPSHPYDIYAKDWRGWPHFLRGEQPRNFYPTLAEASAAARRLGISGVIEYRRRHREDGRLPADPDKFYVAEWVSWPHFLRGEQPRNFYPTLAEASAAARRLGISGVIEYRRRHREDGRLPADPADYYSTEWRSWKHFLTGKSPFYPTLAEASAAAKKLGICTCAEYKRGYKKDGRLPSAPHETYEKDWRGWSHFLGKKPKKI